MDFLFLGVLLLVLIFGPWFYTAVVERRRRQSAELLTSRLEGVERAAQRLFAELAALKQESAAGARREPEHASERSADLPAITRPAAPQPLRSMEPAPEPIHKPAAVADAPPLATPPRVTAPPITSQAATPPAPHADAPPERPHAPSPAARVPGQQPLGTVIPPAPRTAPPSAPTFATVGDDAEKSRNIFDLEETLGANWLNKLGVIILVLGIGFFLAYQLTNLGPAGKVSLGVLVAVVMLGAGIRLEKSERYRIPARALIGGGWALAYFVAFAMYYVPAAKVLQSQPLDLALMMTIAAAMVWHTLRYDSQTVTGMAFMLAFLTVTVHHEAVISLAAGAILAIGLVVIVLWKRWYELEVFGIVAAYLNHFYWLFPIVDRLTPANRSFPEFPYSTALLALYWVTFRGSYLVRRIDDEVQENISTIAALLNVGLFLGLMKYQSAHPEWAFWALLVLGAIEFSLGQIPSARRRRMPLIILTIIGSSLMIAAIPFRYSGNSVAILWLVEGEALFLAGIWARESVFRRLGMLTTLLVTGQLIIQMPEALEAGNWRLGVALLVAAGTFYLDHLWFGRRKREFFTEELDSGALRVISFFGALALIEAVFVMAPDAWIAPACMATAVLLAAACRVVPVDDLTIQAVAAAAVGLLRTAVVNFDLSADWHGVSLRLLTIGAVALLSYATALLLRPKKIGGQFTIAPLFTWAASTLVALLCWYELRPIAVAVAWAVFGLILLELGIAVRSWNLRMQAYVALGAAFVRMYFVNINAAGAAGEISPRVYTIVPLMLIFYFVYERATGSDVLREYGEDQVGRIAAYLGTATVASLAYFELPRIWIAAGWAVMCALLLATAWASKRRVFVHQAVILSIPVAWRAITFNLLQTPNLSAADERWVTAGAAAAGLMAAVGIAFAVRRRDDEAENGMELLFDRRPEQVLFFATIAIVTAMLGLIMRSGMITVSWGLEGVAVFLFALWVSERTFRLCGLGLLLLCVGKILFVDFWALGLRDKWITLIILGAALMLVSFLYTRHRETIRQLL